MIPLYILIAAVRQHETTKHVVPESFRYDDSPTLDDGAWRWTSEGACIPDDIARLAFEAMMFRALARVNPTDAPPHSGVYIAPDGTFEAWHDHGDAVSFGPDLAAALAFACGVPLPDEGEDATR